MYYVYVLKSLKTGEFYKGLTNNIDRRLTEHEHGQTRSTKFRKPFSLMYVHICETRKEARKIEKYLKSGTGRELLIKLISIK